VYILDVGPGTFQFRTVELWTSSTCSFLFVDTDDTGGFCTNRSTLTEGIQNKLYSFQITTGVFLWLSLHFMSYKSVILWWRGFIA